MTIEATLERIATALETIAASSASAPSIVAPVPPVAEQPAPEAEKPKRTPKPKPETPPEPTETPEPPVMTGVEAEAALHGHLGDPEPAAAAPASYSDVQAAATAYSQVGNRDGVMVIFSEFGIKTLKDLKEAQYADIIAKFNEAADALKALGA